MMVPNRVVITRSYQHLNEKDTLLPSGNHQHNYNDVHHDREENSKRTIINLIYHMSVFAIMITVTFVLLVSFYSRRHQGSVHNTNVNNNIDISATTANKNLEKLIDNNDIIPMPYGVNFGSWLSLEDYFFVGDEGAIQVATPSDKTAANCLPPLGQHIKWNSETDLLSSLVRKGGSLKHALQVFQAHRDSFVTMEDLQQLKTWNIHHIRIPLSWCWTDADYETEFRKNDDDQHFKKLFTCQDPYHKNVSWPAISKPWLERFLYLLGDYDLRASLDIHTYPGGTSPGTFSGVWPKPPLFWSGLAENDDDTIGMDILKGIIEWVEELPPNVQKNILAISPMNEPAHLAGVFRHTSQNYLPPLKPEEASNYLESLGGADNFPDGPHLRVFRWLDQAIDLFRNSKLPSKNIQLHMNIHESLLSKDILEIDDDLDEGGRHPSGTKIIANWWSRVTSATERANWAVLDMHHYHAWEPMCQGSIVGSSDGSNYTCSDVKTHHDALRRCASWATDVFRKYVDEYCEKSALLISGEFSTSTHYRVRHACNGVDSLRDSYLYQVRAAQKANVDLFYWSYKMPYGGAAKDAWSFKQLMYDLGQPDATRPDASNIPCSNSEPMEEDAVTDDWFY